MDFIQGGIISFGGNFAPRNWAFCSGQIIAISQNQALYAILGTVWGGDGRTSFALPNMQGRAAIGLGRHPGSVVNILQGHIYGSGTHILTTAELPQHTHEATFNGISSGASSPTATATVNAFEGVATEASPSGQYWSTPKSGINTLASYGTSSNTTMATDAIQVNVTGGSGGITGGTVDIHPTGNQQEFNLLQPSLGMNYMICMEGLFPSRN